MTYIKDLNVRLKSWKIEGRIISKSPIKHWKKKDKEGKLFNIIVLDNTGEIRITAFDEIVDQFYDQLELDKIYYFSNGQIRLKNQMYNSTTHDCEIYLNNETKIDECVETTHEVPEIQYNLKTVTEIKELENNIITDIVAICSFVSELEEFDAVSTGRHLKKRDITLADQTGEIKLTLWNEMAEIQYKKKEILIINDLIVNEFRNEKNLTTTLKTNIRKNTKLEQAKLLKKMKI